MRLDFLAPPSPRRRAVLLLAFGALAAALAAYDDSVAGEEVAQLLERRERAQAAYRRLASASGPSAPVARVAGIEAGEALAGRLALPWGGLLDALEAAQDGNIALLALEADPHKGQLRLSGEARNMAAVVAYIAALDGKAGIAGLRLLALDVKQADPELPVEFLIEGRWRPVDFPGNGGAPT